MKTSAYEELAVSSALADATGVRLPSWRDSLSGVVSAILDTDQLRTSS